MDETYEEFPVSEEELHSDGTTMMFGRIGKFGKKGSEVQIRFRAAGAINAIASVEGVEILLPFQTHCTSAGAFAAVHSHCKFRMKRRIYWRQVK